MADLMKRLDITEAALEKWYRVDTETIRKSGGASLLKQYGNSPVRMLAALFPQHQWVLDFK
jgi:3-keto-L-gulonate-6-phosphate decarboxylase